MTIRVTGGGATDTRSFHWTILQQAMGIPPGQTPVPGSVAFAVNDTFVHQDDIGIVGIPHRVIVKGFLEELDYQTVSNNNLQMKLQVISGPAGLTTDPNDVVGSSSITIWPDSYSGLAGTGHFYVVGHAPSQITDDVVIVAFRQINGAWVQMAGALKENEVKFVIGTKLVAGGRPNNAWNGYVDANTTPQAMWQAGKYRISAA